jgi:hypothetical protein
MTAGSINNLWDAARKRPLLTNPFGSKSPAMLREVALRVTGGLHTGATLVLAEPHYTVGSSTESDIVLRDSGIASVHARLRRRGAEVEVEALGGDVKLTNGEIVPKGHGRRCKLPLQIAFGEAHVLLAGPEQTASDRGILRKPVLVAAGLLIVTLIIAGNSWSLAEAERNNDRESIQQYAAMDASQGGLAPPAQHAASASEAGQQLGKRLAEAGIGTLNIAETNGRLIVSGSISQQQNDVWTGIRSWFDQTYGEHVLLASDVVEGDEQVPRIPLQAIWYGQQPYIITAEGARYHEGAFVSDGWTIAEIGETQLLLTKGGAKVALKYP